MPSVQLSQYLQLRADGEPVETAAEQSGIGLAEALLHEADIESGELPLPAPRVCAGAGARVREGDDEGETKMADDNVAADMLRLFIERIERLREEKKGIADDIRDVFAEAKAQGFDKPAMREILRLREMEPHKRLEWDALVETYRSALGLSAEGEAAALSLVA
jgi:uncharacterized protein (UPF0335 family)